MTNKVSVYRKNLQQPPTEHQKFGIENYSKITDLLTRHSSLLLSIRIRIFNSAIIPCESDNQIFRNVQLHMIFFNKNTVYHQAFAEAEHNLVKTPNH